MKQHELELAILRLAKDMVLSANIYRNFICPHIEEASRSSDIREHMADQPHLVQFLKSEVREFIGGKHVLWQDIPVSSKMQLTFRIAILDTMIARRMK